MGRELLAVAVLVIAMAILALAPRLKPTFIEFLTDALVSLVLGIAMAGTIIGIIASRYLS